MHLLIIIEEIIRKGKRTGSTCVYHKSKPDCAPAMLMDGKRNIRNVIQHINSFDNIFWTDDRKEDENIVLSVFL